MHDIPDKLFFDVNRNPIEKVNNKSRLLLIVMDIISQKGLRRAETKEGTGQDATYIVWGLKVVT